MKRLLRRIEIEWWIVLLALCLLAAFSWPVQRSFIMRLNATLAQSADPNLETILRARMMRDSADTVVIASIQRSRQWQALIPIIVEEQRAALAGMSFALAGLLMVLALLAGRRLTRPLKRLAAAAESIGQGRTATIDTTSGGALGRLEASMSAMQNELEKLRQRAQAEGMEQAWRDIARVMAHEIKNPLTPIQLTIDRIQERIDTGADLPSLELDKFMKRIAEQVMSLERLVNDFRSFAREPEPRLRSVDLGASVEAVSSAMGGALVTNVRGNAAVSADPHLLGQVFLNVWKNALEAGATAMTVDISDTGGTVRLTARDNGPGIPPDRMERVWIPYVTYKPGGTGLGLPVVKRLLESMGATVGAASSTAAAGHGLSVIIEFKGAAS